MKRTIAILIACMLVIALAGCGGKGHEGEAKTPSGSSVQKGRNYQDVFKDFEQKGFKNIKTETQEDLITGWITKDGEVESVSVDGNKDYSPDVWYPDNVEVIITYHTFPAKPGSANQGDVQNDKVDEAANAALELTFPVENAKRSAVVAITNGFATDVFAKDGNSLDVSKFHSYADTSGNVDKYFMKVKSWGTWSAKNGQTWHVDSLILENLLGPVANAALDVTFDGTNYVISNITGTFGNPGAIAGMAMDLRDIESGSNNPYLIVPAKLIKNDRIQAEVDALDHSGDLDKYAARTAFENHGKYLYPYGFDCHWILDLRSEAQSHVDGSWFFKVGVTITNQYGTERNAIAEGTVGGTTGNPIIKDFYVN